MIGTNVLHFQILEKIGEGGMGVVYKAHDTRLDRIVALKFLPDGTSTSDPDGTRFLQEAKAAAALNHPNICTIHGIEQADGRSFIVMEYVNGHTLQEKKRTLSLKQAIDVGIQIAEGLAAAHERGIVHRDIKPENIIIRKDGIVQIMDFGLAKLRGASRLTKHGSTVGTVGYMSPEQVQGLEADHRSDIFSLGVILYELFAGQSPFKGVHEVAITYEIVHVEAPPISSVNPNIDPGLEDLVLACLVKDPRDRSQSAAELARNLRRLRRDSDKTQNRRTSVVMPANQPGVVASSAEPALSSLQWGTGHWLILLGSCAIVAIGTALFVRHLSPAPSKEVRKFTWPTDQANIVLSPDGKKIASSSGRSISIRAFDSMQPVLIEAPEPVTRIIWAPNSEHIAYFTSAYEIRRVSLSGVAHSLIAKTAGNYFPRFWGRDDSLMVSTWDNSGGNTLLKVASSGGSLVPAFGGDSLLSTIRGDLSDVREVPDGRSLILSVNEKEKSRIVVQADGQRRDIYTTPSQSNINAMVYASSGHILFSQRSLVLVDSYDIWVIPFDASTLEATGKPFQVAQNSDYAFSVSDNGMMAYLDRSSVQEGEELVLVSRTGRVLDIISQSNAEISTPALSADGSYIAAMNKKNDTRQKDIWIHDLNKKTRAQFSFGIPDAWLPVWSPNGREIAFTAGYFGGMILYFQPTDGISSAKPLLPPEFAAGLPRFSSDGKYIFFTRWLAATNEGDVWYVNRTRTNTPQPLFESRFWDVYPFPSPDGRYLAYQSNRSGQDEIYVTRFPKADQHWQVSFAGGQCPQWVGDEIFFVSPRKNDLMTARVSTHAEFRAELPQRLFSADSAGVRILGYYTPKYAVTNDGNRIIASRSLVGDTKPYLVIVENWFEEFRNRK